MMNDDDDDDADDDDDVVIFECEDEVEVICMRAIVLVCDLYM